MNNISKTIVISCALVMGSIVGGFAQNDDLTSEHVSSSSQPKKTRIQREYDELLKKRNEFELQIEELALQILSAKKSKIKKLEKQQAAIQEKYNTTQRLIDAYPPSVSDPSIKEREMDKNSAEFRQMMEKKIEQKLSTIDMDKEAAKSDDPELEKAYKEYQQNEKNK